MQKIHSFHELEYILSNIAENMKQIEEVENKIQ
jgi:hypothetical protein